MPKRRKVLRMYHRIRWHRIPLVLITRLPAMLILWPIVMIGEYVKRLYEWCDDHFAALDN